MEMNLQSSQAELNKSRLPTIIPEELQGLLSSRPLLSNETAEEYDQLLTTLALNIEPKDVVEWVWCKDVLDLIWECRRLRAVKAALIETHRLDAARIFGIGTTQQPKRGKDEPDQRPPHGSVSNRQESSRQVEELIRSARFADARGDSKRLVQIENELFQHWGVNFNDISARALGWRLDDVVKIEEMIASCERRRDQTLREIERRRSEKVKASLKAQDIAFSESNPF